VLRLDFRGHGASGRAPGEYSPAGYLSDAVCAIEQVAGRPCAVIGHSLGGVTTAGLAQRHPDLVVAAVMEDPPLGLRESSQPVDGATPALDESNSLLAAFRTIRESAPRLQASGITPDVLAGILAGAPSPTGGTFGELLHPDAVEAMAASLLQVDASVLDPVLTGTIGSFLDADVAFVPPSLIVCADPAKPDAVADPTLAGRFADISPATNVVVLDGAGHLIHDEIGSRDRFRVVATAFIARHGG
jgi:pimeloyl-ACP methyl ester carboxylesterase